MAEDYDQLMTEFGEYFGDEASELLGKIFAAKDAKLAAELSAASDALEAQAAREDAPIGHVLDTSVGRVGEDVQAPDASRDDKILDAIFDGDIARAEEIGGRSIRRANRG